MAEQFYMGRVRPIRNPADGMAVRSAGGEDGLERPIGTPIATIESPVETSSATTTTAARRPQELQHDLHNYTCSTTSTTTTAARSLR